MRTKLMPEEGCNEPGLAVVDWKDPPKEVLTEVDRQLADHGLEVVMHDAMNDSYLWTIEVDPDFGKFVAGRKFVADLRNVPGYGDDIQDRCSGFLYEDQFVIEITDNGKFYLLIENEQLVEANLAVQEVRLHKDAVRQK